MAGKWHLGHAADQDPSKRGFERSFTLLQGGASHFDDEWMMYANYTPTYREDGVRTHVPSGFFSSEFYANQIVKYIKEQKDDNPFFAYLAFTAPHDPLHVPDEWLDKGKGNYNEGYNVLRKKRLARMKAMNIVAKETELAPWVEGIPKWDELTQKQKKHEVRQMEIYSAVVENIDHHIGRVLNYLASTGKDKNTIVIFMSDNGANGFTMSQYPNTDQAWVDRNSDNRFSNWGKKGSRIAQGPGWAQASSTPFRLYKHFLAEGGIRSPFIISGPGINFKNETVNNIAHVMDLAPTFIDLANTSYPTRLNGKAIEQPMGKSMTAFLAKNSDTTYGKDEVLAWEYNDQKSIRMGDYKASWANKPFGKEAWQLFNVSIDPGETNDLSKEKSELKQKLIEKYKEYAKKVGVVPLKAESK